MNVAEGSTSSCSPLSRATQQPESQAVRQLHCNTATLQHYNTATLERPPARELWITPEHVKAQMPPSYASPTIDDLLATKIIFCLSQNLSDNIKQVL